MDKHGLRLLPLRVPLLSSHHQRAAREMTVLKAMRRSPRGGVKLIERAYTARKPILPAKIVSILGIGRHGVRARPNDGGRGTQFVFPRKVYGRRWIEKRSEHAWRCLDLL